MAHMVENTEAAAVQFSPSEITELNSGVRAIKGRGQRSVSKQKKRILIAYHPRTGNTREIATKFSGLSAAI